MHLSAKFSTKHETATTKFSILKYYPDTAVAVSQKFLTLFSKLVSGFSSKPKYLWYDGCVHEVPARDLVGLGGVPADLGPVLLAPHLSS